MHKVFVYGTLRKGFGNHRLLTNSNFIGNAITKEKYTMFASGIPYVNKHIPTHNVIGEIYEVNDEQLNRLDALEGYNPDDHNNSWYKREKIKLNLGDEEEEAYIYFNDYKNETIVESGDYINYRKIY